LIVDAGRAHALCRAVGAIFIEGSAEFAGIAFQVILIVCTGSALSFRLAFSATLKLFPAGSADSSGGCNEKLITNTSGAGVEGRTELAVGVKIVTGDTFSLCRIDVICVCATGTTFTSCATGLAEIVEVGAWEASLIFKEELVRYALGTVIDFCAGVAVGHTEGAVKAFVFFDKELIVALGALGICTLFALRRVELAGFAAVVRLQVIIKLTLGALGG
jgi:hypothetical protein